MNRILIALAVSAMFWAGHAVARPPPAPPLPPGEIVGQVERWSPTDRVIRVSGAEYSLSPDIQIADDRGRQLDSSTLRRGLRVQLTEADGEIQSIIIQPRGTPAVRLPGQ